MVLASVAAAASRVRPRNSSSRRIARAWKYGAPFVLFSVGGLFALSSMVDLKYEKLDTQVKKQSERQFELEEEHARMMKKMELNSYELKPISRPDES